jgi:ADP-heptose:LPS heptosyltransferase
MKIVRVPEKYWQNLSDEELGGKRENTVCVIRYGGFGDALQISPVLKLLKDSGKRVCVNVTERGEDVLINDPNVDELFTQKSDQVPNFELGPYWERITPLFDAVYNLGGIVEQGLLSLAGDPIYDAPHTERHAKLNKNYSEALHDAAGVPHVFKTKFYPSASEHKWVRAQRRNMRIGLSHYVVLITLSGSSVHKAYPHMDAVMAHMLIKWPDVRFIMVGDSMCQMLEVGWESEPRVFLRSGKWSIRQTLAFAQTVDLVVGPETGVLNAVSSEEVAKVALLSHSSKENLTKHWVNTSPIGAEGVDCFPCHKMHFGFATCRRDVETGASMCAAKIHPDDIATAIEHHRKLKDETRQIASVR